MKILTTGTAGFIGSNFIHWMAKKYPDAELAVYDKLTYAGNLNNLVGAKYTFYQNDICDYDAFYRVLNEFQPDYIVALAAETHVDNSISGPQVFLDTNIMGTEVILRAVKDFNSQGGAIKKLVHISTDEVYGSLEAPVEADENHSFKTNSPYSASKASGDLLCRAYYKTYSVPVCIIRGSNCYGPRQHVEKLIPISITKLLSGGKIGLYGSGVNVREWIYTEDFCWGIETVLLKGQLGEAYNLGGSADNRVTNLDIASELLRLLSKPSTDLEFIKDRAGHDMRYALNSEKLKRLGWYPRHNLETGLEATVDWYVNNEWWWKPLL
jgi:dTDP-glucose 4,6-dehydratase